MFSKNIKNLVWRHEDHLRSAKMALQIGIPKKKKCYFQQKIEKNDSGSKVLWKALKSL